jgi:hypothetical protein
VASLTIGQQLGQHLYVRVEQGLGGEGQTNLILEYELTNWLRLRTNVIQGNATQQSLFQRAQGSGRRSAVLLQLLSCEFCPNVWRGLKIFLSCLSWLSCQAFARDATWTRASLKHAPPPRSVSVSGTRAVPVVLFRMAPAPQAFGQATGSGADSPAPPTTGSALHRAR